MNTTKMIFQRLSGDLTLVEALTNYAGLPAIFEDEAPDDFQFDDGPAAVISAPVDDMPTGTFTESGRGISQEIRLYTRRSGSTQDLGRLARHVRSLFHEQEKQLAVEGGRIVIATVSGPVAAPTTDPALIGRRMTLRLAIEET